MSTTTQSDAGISREIVVIGSGFAAQQLVKSLRKLDAEQPIRLITADSGDEYNKPDLSHVVSRGCAAAAMTRQSGSDFAEQQRIALLPHCPVLGIDPARRTLLTSQGSFPYGQLVLATGASAVRPELPGSEHLVTLNSQQEYAAAEGQSSRLAASWCWGPASSAASWRWTWRAMAARSPCWIWPTARSVPCCRHPDPAAATGPAQPGGQPAVRDRSRQDRCPAGRWLARHPE